jgi:DNA adenine methylase
MSDADHADLCAFLKTLTGMVILCGYDNPVYAGLGWQTVKREALADGAQKRTEVLWLNPACVAAQAQMSLLGNA